MCPTEKQKKVAQELIKNTQRDKPMNATDILEKSGYTEITAKSSQKKIIETKGVQEVLKESGFTEDNAKGVVSEILLSKKAQNRDRLKASEQVFKVHGSYAPEKKDIDFKDKTDEDLAKRLAEELAEALSEKLNDENED